MEYLAYGYQLKSLSSNISTVKTNENNNAESLINENTQTKFSEFSGTYIDVFGSSNTLTINNNGKVTISGRTITNSLADLKKQTNGTYSCSIPDGNITIYPAGVSGSPGDNSKIRIEVSENGGAFCFQEE